MQPFVIGLKYLRIEAIQSTVEQTVQLLMAIDIRVYGAAAFYMDRIKSSHTSKSGRLVYFHLVSIGWTMV